jgi:N-acetylglucosaminyldiphosphoundecaprenol N-acetyl-beta-D-mannosaminyltransferase
MRAYGPELDAVLIGVGQAFAIAAGTLAEAPAWMRARGLEWLFRLLSEPRRLASRYLVTNSLFLAYQAAERLRLRGRAGSGATERAGCDGTRPR